MVGAKGDDTSMIVPTEDSSPVGLGVRPAAPSAGGHRQRGPSTTSLPPEETRSDDRETEPDPRVRLWDDIGAYSSASLARTVVVISEDGIPP